MHIHWLQHVSFEGLGCIEPWLTRNGHDVSCTRLWNGEKLPNIGLSAGALAEAENVDGLIIMGGPMGVYDEELYPWLADEKRFIKQIIDQNKPMLGICLGAQLIAEVLGSRLRQGSGGQANVWKNSQKEIGFFPIIGNSESGFSKHWKNQIVFHWHGDTFGIPDGAIHLASSEATENQAFIYSDNVLALQFHLETTEESLLALYENCRDEITDGPFIQTLEKMRENFPNTCGELGRTIGKNNEMMFQTLEKLFTEK